jgi:hypothetical protein
MLQLVVWLGNSQCATLRVVSLLSVANLDDKLKHVGHFVGKTRTYEPITKITLYRLLLQRLYSHDETDLTKPVNI